MNGEEGEFIGDDIVRKVELVLSSTIRVGAALTTTEGADPGVARTLIMAMEHRTNQSKRPPTTTLFGFDQETAVGVCGGLLAAIDMAYGDEVVNDLLVRVAEYVGEQRALRERDENDDR